MTAHDEVPQCCRSCNSSKQDLPQRKWLANLRKRGMDAATIGARVRRQVKRPLDRAEGRRLAALRGGK